MNTKADLSINIIIIAAIALIVLVVLVAVFTGQMSKFIEGLTGVKTTCTDQGGEWRSKDDGCGNDKKLSVTDAMEHEDSVCCKKITTS
jgi:hypothetical protein